jgi:hypothetical protein
VGFAVKRVAFIIQTFPNRRMEFQIVLLSIMFKLMKDVDKIQVIQL